MNNIFRKPGTSSIANTPLLISVVEVAVALLTLHIVTGNVPPSSPFSLILNFLACVFLGATLIYAVYQLYLQTTYAWSDPKAITSLCTSIFLGSFLLSFTSLAFTSIGPYNVVGSGLIVALCVVSLAGLLLFLTPGPVEAETQEQTISHSGRAVPVPLQVDPPGRVYTNMPAKVTSPDAIPIQKPSEKTQLYLQGILNYIPPAGFARFLSVSKNNEHITYNEDACVISLDGTRFALCDGASNSELPRGWAILLGQRWCKESLYPMDEERGINDYEMLKWLESPRLRWAQWVKYVWPFEADEHRQGYKKTLIQDEEVQNILERGALTTFLGLELNRNQMLWRASAIGDTCLFLVKTSHSQSTPILIPIMPITKSTDFNSTPPLLSSHMDESIEYLLPNFTYRQKPYEHGDFLLMATDALARWLTFQAEQGPSESEWLKLLDIRDSQSFARFIQQRRGKNIRQIEPDDTTLVVIPL